MLQLQNSLSQMEMELKGPKEKITVREERWEISQMVKVRVYMKK